MRILKGADRTGASPLLPKRQAATSAPAMNGEKN